jgi:hypothetical protein
MAGRAEVRLISGSAKMPSAGTSLSTDHRLFDPINGRHVSHAWARSWPASDDSGSTMERRRLGRLP